jgi:hypothetical protein
MIITSLIEWSRQDKTLRNLLIARVMGDQGSKQASSPNDQLPYFIIEELMAQPTDAEVLEILAKLALSQD